MILKYEVNFSEQDSTVNNILKNYLYLSKTQIRRAKSNNVIYVNDKICTIKTLVKKNDIVKVKIVEHRISNQIISTNISLDILYEDEYIIAINKPKNMLCHPVGKEITNTLANAIKYYYEQQKVYMVTRPISRLDRNTTGVILFAKNSHVHSMMVKTMNHPLSHKKYLAITNNIPKNNQGIINYKIRIKEGSIIERTIASDGQACLTTYKVIEKYKNSSLIEFILLTGRTHQIRVHCVAYGIPIIGDSLYNKKSDLIDRQALHSYEVFFTHPFTKKEIIIKATLPADMSNLIEVLKS